MKENIEKPGKGRKRRHEKQAEKKAR